MTLDPCRWLTWQSRDELLQCHLIDVLGVALTSQQPPLTGVLAPLSESKPVADFTVCQCMEALVMFFSYATDPLQYSPLQVWVLQHASERGLPRWAAHCKVGHKLTSVTCSNSSVKVSGASCGPVLTSCLGTLTTGATARVTADWTKLWITC